MAKSDKKKRLHARIVLGTLKGLAKDSVKQTGRFKESYLDDEVWSSSWDTIIRNLKTICPETIDLKPKAKAAPKIDKRASGEENGKDI